MTEPMMDKLVVLAADKVLFGIVAALVAYGFQRRLERVKRGEAVFTEHSKQVLRAFSEAMNQVHNIHGSVMSASAVGWPQDRRQVTEAAVEELARHLRENRHYLGVAFFSLGLRFAATARRATELSVADQILELDFELVGLKKVMLEAIPPFARMPRDDPQFKYPTWDEAHYAAGVANPHMEPRSDADAMELSPRPPVTLASGPR